MRNIEFQIIINHIERKLSVAQFYKVTTLHQLFCSFKGFKGAGKKLATIAFGFCSHELVFEVANMSIITQAPIRGLQTT